MILLNVGKVYAKRDVMSKHGNMDKCDNSDDKLIIVIISVLTNENDKADTYFISFVISSNRSMVNRGGAMRTEKELPRNYEFSTGIEIGAVISVPIFTGMSISLEPCGLQCSLGVIFCRNWLASQIKTDDDGRWPSRDNNTHATLLLLLLCIINLSNPMHPIAGIERSKHT